MDYDIIIIGAGVAGMTAAIYVARANKSVLILEEKVPGGQIVNALSISNWPAELGISGAELSEKIYHQANNLGAKIVYERVENVSETYSDSGKKKFLVKTDEREYSSGAIIIATGTEPRKLSKKQMKEVGERPISYCATCDGAIYKDKPVAVIGGGDTAKHEVRYLSNIASKVYQVYRDDPIPDDVVAVFVAVGRVPNTDVFAGLVERDENGYIKAGEGCKTSHEGVFVAGDCRTKGLRQLVTASSDGAMAGIMAMQYLSE